MRELQWCEIAVGESKSCERLGRLWPRQADYRQLSAKVFDLHLIHDDVAAEQRQQRFHLRSLNLKQKALSAIKNIKVALDLPLGIEDKCIDAVANRQVANVVADHAIQPAHPVASGQRDQSAIEPVRSTSSQQSSHFLAAVAWRGRIPLALCNQTHLYHLIIAKQFGSQAFSSQHSAKSSIEVAVNPKQLQDRVVTAC